MAGQRMEGHGMWGSGFSLFPIPTHGSDGMKLTLKLTPELGKPRLTKVQTATAQK